MPQKKAPASNPYKQAMVAPAAIAEAPPESLVADLALAKPVVATQSVPAEIVESSEPVPKKMGRPATGKRSNKEWVGRTYYVRDTTDFDVTEELLVRKRQGQEIDKSELVDKLLTAWVAWQRGEDLEICLSEVSPMQKS
jgi:hypothetical protein